MPTRIDQLFYELDLQRQGFDKAVADVQRQLKRMGKDTGVAASRLGGMEKELKRTGRTAALFRRTLTGVGAAVGAIGITRLVRDLFNTATAVEETGAKFETVFGRMSLSVDDFIDDFGALAGLSRQEARELLATTGAIAQGFGFAQEESAGFAQEIITLAGDLASFNNLAGGAAEAARVLQSALAGERESLKRLGIVIREVDVQQRALTNSGKTSAKALTQQEKATATLQLITEQAGVAVGDLARTQDSAANQARRVRAEFQNIKEELSVSLLPAFSNLLELIQDTVDGWKELIGVSESFVESLRGKSLDFLRLRLEQVNGELERLREQQPDLTAGRALLTGMRIAILGRQPTSELGEQIKELEKQREYILDLITEIEARGASATGKVSTIIASTINAEDAAAKKRAQIAKKLTDLVTDVTLTSAQQQLHAIGELRDEYIKAYGAIGDAAERQFRIIEDAAARALRLEEAQRLADDFRAEIEDGFQQITLASEQFTDEEERRAFVLEQQVRLLEIVRTKAEQRADAAETTTEEEEALRDVIAEIVELLIKALELQQALGDDAGADAERRRRNLQATLHLIQQSVDGTLELARAFGAVDDEIVQTIRSLERMGAGVATLISGLGDPVDIASVISGGLGLLGGLAGLIGGESPAQAANRRVIEQNTQALKELASKVHELAGSFDIAGADFTRTLQALRRVDLGDPRTRLIELSRELQRVGLSFADLDTIAREFGISIRNEAGQLVGEGLEQLLTALEEASEFFVGFPQTIEGTLERLRIEFELFDVDDPIEQLKRIQDELAALTKVSEGVPALAQLFTLDVSTAEGRRRAEELIRELFEGLVTGIITPAELGAATFEEAVNILLQMESLLDDIEANTAETTEGTTQQVSFSTRVTEAQGDAMLSRMDTGLHLGRERNKTLKEMLAVLSGQVAAIAPPTAAAMMGATVTYNIDVDVGDIEVSVASTNATGEEIAGSIREDVDRHLGRELLRQLRTKGLISRP